MKQARDLARIRNTGMAQYRPVKGQNEQQHYVGALGEIAFARTFGLTVEMVQKPNGDDGVDFWLNGKSIDVKSTKVKFPKLISNNDETLRSQIYVLAHINEPKVSLMGWITKSEFIRLHRVIIGLAHHPWYVTPENLCPITTLK